MLVKNLSLENPTIRSRHEIMAEDYAALITILQHNTTLKTLDFREEQRSNTSLGLTTDEDNQMALLLEKNYALESIPDIDLCFENQEGDVGDILRLNRAGRRYLIENGSLISRGVKVSRAVSNETNCIFLNL
jgi:hypothetical protein